MSPVALQFIERALIPLISKGRKLARIKLVVSKQADIAWHQMIRTSCGMLRVEPDGMVPKGLAYLIEDPGMGRVFAWVMRRNKGRELHD